MLFFFRAFSWALLRDNPCARQLSVLKFCCAHGYGFNFSHLATYNLLSCFCRFEIAASWLVNSCRFLT